MVELFMSVLSFLSFYAPVSHAVFAPAFVFCSYSGVIIYTFARDGRGFSSARLAVSVFLLPTRTRFPARSTDHRLTTRSASRSAHNTRATPLRRSARVPLSSLQT